jgi:hypothetical protein
MTAKGKRMTRKAAVAEPTLELPEVSPIPNLVWVRTDDLSRNPESQIRIESDTSLVLEYAEAMLEGAEFPPVIIFQDADDWKYLADGHHRVDAAALAALKDPRRKAEVLAEIRPGGFVDALRYAMGANTRHGKRLTEADYRRAIGLAITHKMLTSQHAKDVVPEIVALVGCSVRTAQHHSADYRRELIAKRDRLICAMHRQGRSQEAIGAALEVAARTVSHVIERFSQKRSAAGMAETTLPEAPKVDWPEADDPDDAEEDEAPADDEAAPTLKFDMSPYLPLLEKMRPIDEGGDDTESGAVGLLEDVEAEEPDPVALALLAKMAARTTAFLKIMERRTERLAKHRFSASACGPLIEQLDLALDFFDALKAYLEEMAP